MVETITLGTPIGSARMPCGGQRGAAGAAGRDEAAEVAARAARSARRRAPSPSTALPRSPLKTADSPCGWWRATSRGCTLAGDGLPEVDEVDRDDAQAELFEALAQEGRARGPWCRRCRRRRRRGRCWRRPGSRTPAPGDALAQARPWRLAPVAGRGAPAAHARDVGHRRRGAAGVPAREAAHRARRQVVERGRAVAVGAAHREHLGRRRLGVGGAAGASGSSSSPPPERTPSRRSCSSRSAASSAAGISLRDAAVDHHADAIGDVDRDAEVLLDQQHRDLALGRQVAQRLRPPARRSPAPGPRSARPSPAAAGSSSSARPIASICCSPPESCAPPLSAPLGQAREHRVDAVDLAPLPRDQAQRLVDRQRGPDAPALRHVGDAALRDLVRRQAEDLLAEQPDAAAAPAPAR